MKIQCAGRVALIHCGPKTGVPGEPEGHLEKVGDVIAAGCDGAYFHRAGEVQRWMQVGPSKSLRRARVMIKQMLRAACAE